MFSRFFYLLRVKSRQYVCFWFYKRKNLNNFFQINLFSRKKYSCQPKKASKKLELSTISSLGYQYQNSYFKISGIWVFEQKSNILIWLIPKPYIFTKYTESQKNVWKWHEFLREFELFELFELFEYLTEKYSIFDLQLFLFELETLVTRKLCWIVVAKAF